MPCRNDLDHADKIVCEVSSLIAVVILIEESDAFTRQQFRLHAATLLQLAGDMLADLSRRLDDERAREARNGT
jgi:hypothetical protein